MTELLAVVERGKDSLLSVEEHLSRAAGGENPLEAGAPPAAGGDCTFPGHGNGPGGCPPGQGGVPPGHGGVPPGQFGRP